MRVTVVEDDVPVVTLTAPTSVAENAGPARFSVAVDKDTDREIAIDYATADGTAAGAGRLRDPRAAR